MTTWQILVLAIGIPVVIVGLTLGLTFYATKRTNQRRQATIEQRGYFWIGSSPELATFWRAARHEQPGPRSAMAANQGFSGRVGDVDFKAFNADYGNGFIEQVVTIDLPQPLPWAHVGSDSARKGKGDEVSFSEHLTVRSQDDAFSRWLISQPVMTFFVQWGWPHELMVVDNHLVASRHHYGLINDAAHIRWKGVDFLDAVPDVVAQLSKLAAMMAAQPWSLA